MSMIARLSPLGSLICRLFARCLAGGVIFRSDAELFGQMNTDGQFGRCYLKGVALNS